MLWIAFIIWFVCAVEAKPRFGVSVGHHGIPSSTGVIIAALSDKGTAHIPTPAPKSPYSVRRTIASKLLSAWGVIFVLSLLGNTLRRLVPIAMQPIINKDLSVAETVSYIVWSLFMTYVEGYKAFHLKFVPLVVRRSQTLIEHPSVLNYIFAGPYSMGLFYSTKKRKIISWAVTSGVFALVMIVKRLPYPWRSIIDAGVVCGLSFGALSMAVQFIRGVFGYIPDVDPCLPAPDDVPSVDASGVNTKTK